MGTIVKCKLLFMVSCLLAITSGWGQSAQPIPEGGIDLVSEQTFLQPGFWGGSGDATLSRVDATGPTFSEALEIRIPEPGAEVWDGQVSMALSQSVSEGDTALLHFWMRVTETVEESGAGPILAMVEEAASPYEKSVWNIISASAEWHPFYFPFTFVDDYDVGEVLVKLGLGQGKSRTVQIGGLRLIQYGTARDPDELPRTAFSYGGREPEASWREAAAARIETYRKADYSIRLYAESGEGISGSVHLRLERHAFHFGSVFDANMLMGTGSDSEMYREKMLELFNASGPENDLKWPALIGEWGNYFNQTRTRNALEWLRLRGFFLRGHVLVWPGANNLPNLINQRINAGGTALQSVPGEVLSHIETTVGAFSPWLDEWDVVNEPFDNHTLMDLFEGEHPGLMADWFIQARVAGGPDLGLYLNDYGILSGLGMSTVKHAATKDTIHKIKNHGGPITGFGFQGHFSESSLTDIPRIYEIIESFADAFPDLRFRITEFDIDTTDLELQADFLRDFLTIVFSHPQVDGFQLWGFWEGRHWKPEAAFYKMDWTPRPQKFAYQELLAEWSSRFDLETDSASSLSGRGFKGHYVGYLLTDQGRIDLQLPLLDEVEEYQLMVPDADTLTHTRMLPPPAPGRIGMVFPTIAGGAYQLEISHDLETWRAVSIPGEGSGHPRMVILEAPSRLTFWRVVTPPGD